MVQSQNASNRGQVPIEALRDLLAIARCLYLAAKRDGSGAFRVQQLEQAGQELRRALDLASTTGPDTMGHRAAWVWFQRGYERLTQQITSYTELKPVMAVAVARVLRRLG